MEIIAPQNNGELIKSKVKGVDDTTLERLSDIAIAMRKDEEQDTLYSKFYESKYSIASSDIARKEENLTTKLNTLQSQDGELVKTSLQGNEYRWIQILRHQIGKTAFRFYLAPNPNNMHEIVEKLVKQFLKEKVPVKFKYQQEGKMSDCDRLIIYSDAANKGKIEDSLAEVYRNNPQIFYGSERALPWLYEAKVPGIYVAPETPGSSYGKEFARTIMESREIFGYLQGETEAKPLGVLDENYARGYIKQIIGSMLLRNGMLMSTDGMRVLCKDDNISTGYDYKTGKLTNRNKGQQKYSEAIFLPTREGRTALLNNFYNVSGIESQTGVIVQHLTPEQRRMQLYKKLYPDKFGGEPTEDGNR